VVVDRFYWYTVIPEHKTLCTTMTNSTLQLLFDCLFIFCPCCNHCKKMSLTTWCYQLLALGATNTNTTTNPATAWQSPKQAQQLTLPLHLAVMMEFSFFCCFQCQCHGTIQHDNTGIMLSVNAAQVECCCI